MSQLSPFDQPPADPPHDCAVCPRLAAFRSDWRQREPGWFNGPVPVFGGRQARLLLVGLAPGLRGANRTGRPFTGDFAGNLLYETLIAFGFAHGRYEARPDDGLTLVDTAIVNAVRCVPPENKPTPQEIGNCRPFLKAAIADRSQLRVVVALGKIAHDSVTRAFGLPAARLAFGHGARHVLPTGIALFDSYHCSRYNTNTGVLTPEMFRAVFAAVQIYLQTHE